MKGLILFLLCISLSSCGLFKKVTRVKANERLEVEQKSSSESTIGIVDRTVTVTSEKADTTVVVPASVSYGTKKIGLELDSLINGFTAISNELVDIRLVLDSSGMLTTTATLRPRPVKVGFERTVTRSNDIVTSLASKNTSETTETYQRKETKKEKQPAKMGMWFAAVALAMLLFFGFLWLRTRR